MIYLDTSVVLAHLLGETRAPPASLWDEALFTSRLLQYEVWTRMNARALDGSHGEAVRLLLGQLAFVELTPDVLGRALEPWPVPTRTLDALHLATALFLRENGHEVRLATYDERLAAAADAIGLRRLAL